MSNFWGAVQKQILVTDGLLFFKARLNNDIDMFQYKIKN
ncbi:hypothetical protein MCC93_09290 [Morococcus cerebrosus]|uniref:Transposase n=1 Tax=Morococcus cerebrosus TaxID=1056807 RepID=A0A0C1EBD6_9NEIS|nr:hypothetical protein MCC93_09290 [Morococcus cerebrosus]